jgi:2-oxoisovalerate dehydrogenase E1 component alpha subunit
MLRTSSERDVKVFMTTARRDREQPTPRAVPNGPAALLPCASPVRFLDEQGRLVEEHATYELPTADQALQIYRKMVIGRRFDAQASALTKQGRLAVYPSSRGQEACQAAPSVLLRSEDWLFSTYRDTAALVARGIDPLEALGLLRGTAHCGFDPSVHHCAPQCTPVATHALHAVGLADAARRSHEDVVALALLGDGATSEGDFHEACNYAGVFGAPVVFLVQNNRYAISVPLERQTAAPALSYRGIGYGIRGEQVDGNDPLAMLSVLSTALERARAGGGPTLIEAHTYRLEPHTNSDNAGRYRSEEEEASWVARDPISRLETYLRARGVLGVAMIEAVREEGEALAADLRTRIAVDPTLDPLALFDHVYATPTPLLEQERRALATEIEQER